MPKTGNIIDEVVEEQVVDRKIVDSWVILEMKKRGILPFEGGEVSSADQDREIAEEKVEEVRAIVREVLAVSQGSRM